MLIKPEPHYLKKDTFKFNVEIIFFIKYMQFLELIINLTKLRFDRKFRKLFYYFFSEYFSPMTSFTTYPFAVENGPSYIVVVFKTEEGKPYDIPFDGSIYAFTVSEYMLTETIVLVFINLFNLFQSCRIICV